MLMIVNNGPDYRVEPLPEGVLPDVVMAENYPGWIYVGDASTTAEADSKIECDRARHRTDSF